MSTSNDVELPKSYAAWVVPAQLAAWSLCVISVFVMPPPDAWIDAPTNGVFLPLVQFVCAAVLGLVLIAARRLKRSPSWWAVAAVTVGGGAILLTFLYYILLSEWTCFYFTAEQTRTFVVIGDDLLGSVPERLAVEYQAGGMSCVELVQGVGGLTDRLWDRRVILTRQLSLALIFAVAVCAYSASIFAIIEGLNRSRPAAKRTRSSS